MSRRMLAVFAVAIALAASPALAHAPLACTPGFWKNHLLESHGPNAQLCPTDPAFTFNCANTPGALLDCAAGPGVCTCAELVAYLSAEEGATALERAAAQGCLNIVAQDQLGNFNIVCD